MPNSETYVQERILVAGENDVTRHDADARLALPRIDHVVLCSNAEETAKLWVQSHALANISTKEFCAGRVILLADLDELCTLGRPLVREVEVDNLCNSCVSQSD
jgi:predicted metalloenzyme YecM